MACKFGGHYARIAYTFETQREEGITI